MIYVYHAYDVTYCLTNMLFKLFKLFKLFNL
jgi:hypothetical protein